jgi:hypothetical protein
MQLSRANYGLSEEVSLTTFDSLLGNIGGFTVLVYVFFITITFTYEEFK